MKRVLDFDGLHLLFAVPYFIGVSVMSVAGIYALSLMGSTFEPWVYIAANIFVIFSFIMTFYLAFFTRFNNPFRKKPDQDEGVRPEGGWRKPL